MSFGSCFILYYKSNDMKHISFLNDSVFMDAVINFNRSSPEIPDGLPSFSAIYPLDIAPFSEFSPWGYFLIGVCIVSALALVLLLYSNKQLRRKKIAYQHRSADQLRFIRSLLDLCYTYAESPVVFIDKFKDKVNIRELKSYDLIDTSDKQFSNLKEDERLLCMLWDHGFSQRELCVIFNLKKVSNLYTKYHRIRKKLENGQSESGRTF